MPAPAPIPPVLQVEDVTKRFPGVLANDHVSLTLRRGEILALLGENGAGKSTLMNIIYGLYRPDSGTIRLKGREVHFASPREAIHSGIGMVHQHFQLVPVMTVAENVVLGEEATIAYQGERGTWLAQALAWLPSLVIFGLALLTGIVLGEARLLLGSALVGIVLAVLVALPPWGRFVWGVAWRVLLGFAAVAIASQVEQITRVGLTAVALQQKVETVQERRPQETDAGLTVKVALVQRAPVPFDWSRQYRAAGEAGTGMNGVIAKALELMEPYRNQGIPGWLLDSVNDAPPVARAGGVALLLFLFGAYGVRSWRGSNQRPGRLTEVDLVALAGLLVLYVALAWINLDTVSRPAQIALFALVAIGLAAVAWRTYLRRQHAAEADPLDPAALDEVLDTLMVALQHVTEVGNERRASARVRELSRQYGLEVDPDVVVQKLPVGAQQRVEIIKALYRQADILILDEPTAVLTPQESRELFKIMRGLAAQGVSIIFITHKLKEVFEVATQIVVMRDGRVVGVADPATATETSLAEMMVGREVILEVEKGEAQPGEPVLAVHDLSAYDDRGARALNDVSFAVRAGEVLGVAGVQGNGQTELVEVLTGLRAATSGSVDLLGRELQPEEQPEAGLSARIAAFLIDAVIVLALAYFLGYFVWYLNEGALQAASAAARVGTAALVFVVVDALYFLGSWIAAGNTVGMALFSLKVVDRRDEKAPRFKLAQRYLIFLLLHAPAGIPLLLSYALARRRMPPRTWFDRLLGLRVIRHEYITPRRIKDLGTSHVPEDRQRHGLVALYTVADNLVLNDYYERPYAGEPNLAELPGALLRYLALAGLIVAALTGLGLYVWHEWLWNALLDAYNVPTSLRDLSGSVTGAQRAAFQYPYLIGAVLLLVAELVFIAVAHLLAIRILGAGAVRQVTLRLRAGARRLARGRGRADELPPPEGGLLRNDAAINRHAVRLIDQYDIRTPTPELLAGNLSGGNQQKMIVAREFSRRPLLLIAAQPTRGIDVGSIEFIHNQIIEQRDAGAAVLLVSAELDEIMALSDRIAVLYKGEIIETLPARDARREQLGLLMAGIKPSAQAAPA